MRDYDAKIAYQNLEEAKNYDVKRFSSWRGQLGDFLDKRALARGISAIQEPGNRGLRILDIPCGTGRLTQHLLSQGHHVIGADISIEMMQVAIEKVNEYKNFGGFFQCDASNLIFPDRSLDCVVSVRFMGHIPEEVRSRILLEIHRVSRYAIIEYSIHSLFVTLRLRFERSIGHKALLPQRWGWHRFERSELINELSEAKLQIVKMWPKLPFLSDSWYVLVARQSG